MRNTGTFLDEITHDIPSANWGAREWARDFDAMHAVGIETVILIRAGYRDRMTHELNSYNEGALQLYVRLARTHGLRPWSNVESFERGMPMDFLPIDWRNLRYKIDVARDAQVEKLITFEFSHFMSPNSVYPSAHNL